MSYYVRFNYIENVKKDKVLDTVLQLKREILNNYQKIIEDNLGYRPSFINDAEYNYNDLRDYYKDYGNYTLNNKWLLSLFSLKIIYYPQYEILSFMSQDDDLNKKFPYVEFQNSSDQDYDKSLYHGFKFAEQIYNEIYSFGDEELTKLYMDISGDVLTTYDEYKENLQSDRNYYIQSLIYNKIEKMLDISRYLYARDTFDDENHYCLYFHFVEEQASFYIKLKQHFIPLLKREIEKNFDKEPINIHIENDEEVGECPCCHEIIQRKSNKSWCNKCMQLLKWDKNDKKEKENNNGSSN